MAAEMSVPSLLRLFERSLTHFEEGVNFHRGRIKHSANTDYQDHGSIFPADIMCIMYIISELFFVFFVEKDYIIVFCYIIN